MRRLIFAAILCATAAAHAEPITLRFATEAPDGTAWARLFRAMGRDIESSTRGEVGSKWYVGGIAGSELQMLDRLRRNQLDVVMSGGVLCMKLSPSMRALRQMGLFRSREEAAYVLGRLRPTIDAEFARNGFHNVGEAGLGGELIFSRQPVASLSDLKRARLWFWDLDETLRRQLAALGVGGAVGLPIEEAGRAYEERRSDGFLSVPSAALAFQWSAQTPYLSELRVGYLFGCMVIANHAWDSLSFDARGLLVEATGKFAARLEDLGRHQDAELVGSLFARQGVKQTPVSPSFAAEFAGAARAARAALRDTVIPGELVDRVNGWLAEYRASNPSAAPATAIKR